MNLETQVSSKKRTPNKFVMGFAALAAITVVGATGVVGATPQKAANTPMPPNKAACKNGGYADYGFKNQGQCVKWFNQHGSGYGGNGGGNTTANTTNNTQNNINVEGNNNVIQVIIYNITNIFS